MYTTTCDDVEKKIKKKHMTEPLYLDAESLKVKIKFIWSNHNKLKLNQSLFLSQKTVVLILDPFKSFNSSRF